MFLKATEGRRDDVFQALAPRLASCRDLRPAELALALDALSRVPELGAESGAMRKLEAGCGRGGGGVGDGGMGDGGMGGWGWTRQAAQV